MRKGVTLRELMQRRGWETNVKVPEDAIDKFAVHHINRNVVYPLPRLRSPPSSGLPSAGNDNRLVERAPIFLLANRVHRAKFPQQLVDQRAQARSWRAVRK